MQIIKIPIIKDWTIIFEFCQADLPTMIRYQKYFQRLLEENVFETKGGKVVLNFDKDKNMREIEFQFKKKFI